MNKLVMFFLVAALVIFRGIFSGSVFWGDAPHFFPEEVVQFQHEPLSWTALGNNFGGVNLPLWLSPLMFLWRYIPPQFLFVFPSILLSAAGSWLLTRHLKFGKQAQFISASVYTFNTYFLLLVDGGQMGVELSYGIFPFTLLFLKKVIDAPKFKSFYPALIVLILNGLADPRIALIAVATMVVWNVSDVKKLFSLVPVGIFWLLINSFWVLPFVLSKGGLSALGTLGVQPVKFYDPFLLFSPHYPDNLFGKLNSPPLYFLFIPILTAIGFVISKKLKNIEYFLLYIFFSILAAIPMGIVFRDSTKFYIPVILFAGILIGWTVEVIKRSWFTVITFLFIIFLVSPTISGKMNFVLSGRAQSSDFVKIYNNLKNGSGFFRTAWFPERHPMAFETEQNPGIDAKDLTKMVPFSHINIGEDPFNFINNESFVDNFKTLGIKYLLLSGNPREVSKTEEEQKNWDSIITAVSKTKGLERVDWGVNFPIFKIDDVYPHFFMVDKLIGVVGAPISMKYPTIYFEDGKIDPRTLTNVDPKSFTIFFNGKDKNDLLMSELQKYFVFPDSAKSSQWGVFDTTQYLKYRYQLLIRGINFNDFDYGGGIAFSSIKGEKISFNFKVPGDGDYILGRRTMGTGDSGMGWKIDEPKHLAEGNFSYTLTNDSGLEVLNAVALIPVDAFNKARISSDGLLNRFGTLSIGDLGDLTKIRTLSFKEADTLNYNFDVSGGPGWIIFTDNFNPSWEAKNTDTLLHMPIYSMVNGFYIGDTSGKVNIRYKGQDDFRRGVLISLVTLGTLILVYVTYEKLLKRNSRN